MTFAHALPFSISVCMLQHIAAFKHDTLYVSYSCLAVSTETLNCESIKQSQMKLEKKMAENKAINSALQELQHVRGGEENTNLYPNFGVCITFFSPEI